MFRNSLSIAIAIARLAAGRAPLMLVALLLPALPAQAQDTRQAQQAAARASKASELSAYVPDGLERRLESVEGMLSSKRPVYLAMGSLFEGAGISFGPGYRRRFADTGSLDTKATYSIRNVRSADAKLTLPTAVGGRLAIDAHANWVDAPGAAFYGVGGDTVKAGRTPFHFRATVVGVSGAVKATRRLGVGASFDAVQAEGSQDRLFTVAAASPVYRRTTLNVGFDSRTSPDYSRRGGLYRAEWSNYQQTNEGVHSFRRLDAEVQQFVPLMRENWVLAFRALASTTETDAGQDVPFFLLPELGGNSMLRGFPAWRFRDRNRMLLSGEYRWSAGPLIDMAVFVDAGKVTARRADLNFKGLEVTHGVGLRLHTPSATITRLEVARSREGMSFILSFNPSF
jgi:hypothetical protein